MHDGDLVIRRRAAHVRACQDAEAARPAEIIADSRHHSPGGISIRELLAEGRRG